MQTKYNIGQFVEVRAFDCSYGTHICRFEIKSITILKNNIMYNMEKNLSKLDNMTTMNPYDTFDYNSYEQQNRINYFKERGYECLVIWENELKNIDLVINKVRNFLGK